MLKGLGGLSGLGDMAKMMKAAQEMQAKLGEVQEQLANTVVTGEAGAGLVKVRATAKGDITGLDIDPLILVASEKEVVEDLILAAVRDALLQGKLRTEQEMANLATALGIPPGTKLPF
jgi:nucleoid-associated protein EbfC